MSSIKEVAKRAGVSTATVSRFFNTPEQLRESTQEKVKQAIEQTGYSVNALARNFRRGKTNLIIVVLPALGVPYFASVMRGIESVAKAKGYSIMIKDTQFNTVPFNQVSDMFFSRQADGIILLGSISPYQDVVSRNGHTNSLPPLVVSCENASPDLAGLPSVRIDGIKAAFDATNYLISLGHRKIAFISGSLSQAVSGEREAGYSKAMKQAKLAIHEDLITDGHLTIEDGRRITRRLLNQPSRPTALLCANDEMALGAMHEIKLAGLSVPGDISVIGFDDIRYAEISDPPLTTIAQPGEEIGEKSMYKLCNIIDGQAIDNKTDVVEHQLIIRSSTAPAVL